ncbi:diacylglycerol/lipid kinase family protein [Pelagibius sp.]|uniref:diacylglycerol/lipid kinase family protein n=1 Tax=Pelagibius sp. TaxID=1931238 RepID=UPI003B50644C
MGKLGVITNPRSQKNKQGLEKLTATLEAMPEARQVVLEAMTDIPAILADFARQEVDTVAVAGGDGTVQAVLTALFDERPYDDPPRLAVLPCGMTNMIAGDVGLRGSLRGGLEKLGSLLRTGGPDAIAGATVTRQILRLENARGKGPQYGMFFGGAAIYRAIIACRAKVHPYRIKADTAAAVTLAGILAGWLLRGGETAGPAGEPARKVFSGDKIDVTFDNQPVEHLTSLIILATTLDRLILGSRPFWNGGDGQMRFTSIAYPPDRLLRYAWRVLYGGEDRRLPESSYLSRGANRVSLAMNCPFTLDGELFEPEPGQPIILAASDQARFLRI